MLFSQVDLYFLLLLKRHEQQLQAQIVPIRSALSANLPLTYIKSMSLSARLFFFFFPPAEELTQVVTRLSARVTLSVDFCSQ